MIKNKRKFKTILFTSLALLVTAGVALAADGGAATDLGGMAASVTKSFTQFGQLLIAVSYVAGIGLCIVSIFKFKQHKDTPNQVKLGTPITLLAVGIVLIFFPALLKPAGTTLFGGDVSSQAGGFTGTGGSLPGGGGSAPAS